MPSASFIDFSAAPLASSYSNFYATVIDDAFTPSECAALVELAESTPGGWQHAGISTRSDEQTVHLNFRNSERILRIDDDTCSVPVRKPLIH